mgnify:CR=1 FL=1
MLERFSNEVKYTIFVLASRKLEDNFELLEGRLSAPVDVLRHKRPYKYIVLKGKKEKLPYIWDHLPGHGPYRNRCLKISSARCLSGGQFLVLSRSDVFKECTCNLTTKSSTKQGNETGWYSGVNNEVLLI